MTRYCKNIGCFDARTVGDLRMLLENDGVVFVIPDEIFIGKADALRILECTLATTEQTQRTEGVRPRLQTMHVHEFASLVKENLYEPAEEEYVHESAEEEYVHESAEEANVHVDANQYDLQQYLSIYSTIKTTFKTYGNNNDPIECSKYLLYAMDFCKKYGYPMWPYIESLDLGSLTKIISIPSDIMHYVEQQNNTLFIFLDLFPQLESPLLACMREVFKRCNRCELEGNANKSNAQNVKNKNNEGNVKQSNEQNKSLEYTQFQSATEEARWIANKIKEHQQHSAHQQKKYQLVITDDIYIQQQIKAELAALGVQINVPQADFAPQPNCAPQSDFAPRMSYQKTLHRLEEKDELQGASTVLRERLANTRLGALIVETAAHATPADTVADGADAVAIKTAATLTDNLDSAENSLSIHIARHEQVIENIYASNPNALDITNEVDIVHDFLKNIKICYKNIDKDEYIKLIEILVQRYIVLLELTPIATEEPYTQDTNINIAPPIVKFVSVRNALHHNCDVVFLPGMNERSWMSDTQIPSMIAPNFYEMYDVPLEEEIFKRIVGAFNSDNEVAGAFNSDNKIVDTFNSNKESHLHITCSSEKNLHRFLQNIPQANVSASIPQTNVSAPAPQTNVGAPATQTNVSASPPPHAPQRICPKPRSSAVINVPPHLKPKELSVYDLQLLKDDPYQFFTKRILKLSPRPPENSAAPNLNLAHAARQLLRDYFNGDFFFQHVALMDFARQSPFWLPRLTPAFEQIYSDLTMDRAHLRKIEPEYRLKMALLGGEYKIHARADRVDFFDDGTVRLVEYKVGTMPSESSILKLDSLHLPLKARMLLDQHKNIAINVVQLTRELGRVHTLKMRVAEGFANAVDGAVCELLGRYQGESFFLTPCE
ncbi:MAG: PD-(D/E)XK nuclease family protein [Holosporales bacterium]|jgi:hypothetical protein|nr:PD-(D/E)XK nuclease family protein [Holosporales bacterium]